MVLVPQIVWLPLAFLIDKNLGIDSGYMTTVHSVTGDQNTIDTIHKDLRRARNSLISIIPHQLVQQEQSRSFT